jgi:G:T-mismatch repair DNA endonuclease (very short patch repair protein)
MLVCQICKFESSLSLISHITRKHNTQMSDYRKSFPDHPVQRLSSQQREKISQHHKDRLQDPAQMQKFQDWRSLPIQLKHWTRKGMTQDEARVMVSETQRRNSLRGNNDATHRKRSERSSGTDNPMSLASIAKRHGVDVKQASFLTPCYGRRGTLHPMFGKRHTDEAIRKIGARINTTRISRAEHDLTDRLVLKYGGGKNQSVDGWCCDYVHTERKMVIEFFGDFWHHNPSMYESCWVNPFTKRTTSEVRERDERKLRELRHLGYTVVVVWERDWRDNQELQLKRIDDDFNQL